MLPAISILKLIHKASRRCNASPYDTPFTTSGIVATGLRVTVVGGGLVVGGIVVGGIVVVDDEVVDVEKANFDRSVNSEVPAAVVGRSLPAKRRVAARATRPIAIPTIARATSWCCFRVPTTGDCRSPGLPDPSSFDSNPPESATARTEVVSKDGGSVSATGGADWVVGGIGGWGTGEGSSASRAMGSPHVVQNDSATRVPHCWQYLLRSTPHSSQKFLPLFAPHFGQVIIDSTPPYRPTSGHLRLASLLQTSSARRDRNLPTRTTVLSPGNVR